MTRPWGELTTYRARGGHATDWANPTRFIKHEHWMNISGLLTQSATASGHKFGDREHDDASSNMVIKFFNCIKDIYWIK